MARVDSQHVIEKKNLRLAMTRNPLHVSGRHPRRFDYDLQNLRGKERFDGRGNVSARKAENELYVKFARTYCGFYIGNVRPTKS